MRVKSAIKTALRWTVPAGVNDLVLAQWRRFFASGFFDPEQRRTLAANHVFRNVHQGKRGFIIGTGRSIRGQDLRPLQGEICLALHMFYLHKDYAQIRPRYHMINASVNHPLLGLELGLQWFREMDERILSETLFFNYMTRRFIQQHGFFRGRRVYYSKEESQEQGFRRRGIDATRLLYPMHGIATKALQMVLYMGFREIYLLGLDHDYLARLSPQTPSHFYEPAETVLGTRGLSEWDHLLWRNRQMAVWRDFEFLKQLAQAQGVRVYNATAGGYLETFERVDYSSLFAVPQHENSGHHFSS